MNSRQSNYPYIQNKNSPAYNTQVNNLQQNYHRNYQPQQYRVCPRCGNVHFAYRDYYVNEPPVIAIVFIIIFIFIPIIGWIIDGVLLTADYSSLYTFATCTQCGYRINVQKEYEKLVNENMKSYQKLQKEKWAEYKENLKIQRKQKRLQKRKIRSQRKHTK